MSGRLHRISEARRTAARQLREAGNEIRLARLAAGMTHAQVAGRIGCARQRVARFEAGRVASVPLADLSAVAAIVGLRLQVRAFPAGPPLRDLAQLSVTHRLRRRIAQAWRIVLEVPVRIAGDLRAFDLLLRERVTGAVVCVEIITRLADAQAQLRAVHLKWRDGAPPGAGSSWSRPMAAPPRRAAGQPARAYRPVIMPVATTLPSMAARSSEREKPASTGSVALSP
jgi:transcriptional regulator with XRE-family HTH domain